MIPLQRRKPDKTRKRQFPFFVLNNVILADSIRSNPAKYEATEDEAKELYAVLVAVNQQLKDTLNLLRDLQKRNLLEIEFEFMLETKCSILDGLSEQASILSFRSGLHQCF